jgi:uncharacterized membrane protein YphA (DoxX/SURF4 family)
MDQATSIVPVRYAAHQTTLDSLAPYVRSILRIMVGLLFLEHGLSRLFGFPSPLPTPASFTMYWFAGAIEFSGGILVTLGLFTRAAAFIMSGEMAFAYFISHAPKGFFPDPQWRRRPDPLLLHLPVSGVRRRGAVEPRRAGVGQALTARRLII